MVLFGGRRNSVVRLCPICFVFLRGGGGGGEMAAKAAKEATRRTMRNGDKQQPHSALLFLKYENLSDSEKNISRQ